VPSGRPLIALTGATGFIGQHLLHELPKRGYRLRVLLRRPTVVPLESASAVVGDLARPQNMTAALADVDAVIHSAGLAHAMSGLPEDDYRTLNTEATIALARAAQRAGAKRFVFLSSIRAQSADQEALRIPAIVAALRHGLGRRPGVIPVPVAVLKDRITRGRTRRDLRAPLELAGRRAGRTSRTWLVAACHQHRRGSLPSP
jgi:uncharacterized protein YbjT (DUF2867 family)